VQAAARLPEQALLHERALVGGGATALQPRVDERLSVKEEAHCLR